MWPLTFRSTSKRLIMHEGTLLKLLSINIIVFLYMITNFNFKCWLLSNCSASIHPLCPFKRLVCSDWSALTGLRGHCRIHSVHVFVTTAVLRTVTVPLRHHNLTEDLMAHLKTVYTTWTGSRQAWRSSSYNRTTKYMMNEDWLLEGDECHAGWLPVHVV